MIIAERAEFNIRQREAYYKHIGREDPMIKSSPSPGSANKSLNDGSHTSVVSDFEMSLDQSNEPKKKAVDFYIPFIDELPTRDDKQVVKDTCKGWFEEHPTPSSRTPDCEDRLDQVRAMLAVDDQRWSGLIPSHKKWGRRRWRHLTRTFNTMLGSWD